MPLCEVVAELADSIASVRHPFTPREAFLLHLLRSMPLYRDIHRLDLWDHCCGQVMKMRNGELTETERLIDFVWELGAENLYGAFDRPVTKTCFDRVAPDLVSAGIPVPKAPDLSGW
jgi:hypothetical protein